MTIETRRRNGHNSNSMIIHKSNFAPSTGTMCAVLGIVAAIVIPFLWPLTTREIILVISGAFACVPMVLVFGKEFMTP